MFRSILLIVSIAFLGGLAAGQEPFNDKQVTITTAADVQSRRQALVQFVWGPEGMPLTRLPRLPVIRNDISPIAGLTNLERVDTLIVDMDAGVKSYAHHFIPKIRNERLVILHSGHFATFNDSSVPADEGFGMRRTIEALLGDGFSVLAVYMPRNVAFTTSIDVSDDGGLDAHNAFFTEEIYRPKTGSPLKYFLEPVTVYLNYLSSRSAIDGFPVYRDFSMVGFSGGGWATTVYAALDVRIALSISVAGSMPLYLRSGAAVGDTEQTIPEFYSIAGYPDLYVLGTHGSGRKQIQILNRNDWCCFSQVHHDMTLSGGLTFDETVRDYEWTVRHSLIGMGNAALFSVEIDEAAPGHNVTWDAIFDTILPELNEGRRSVATATGIEAAARGAQGMPATFINGIWSPSKLPLMIGTPALIRGGVSPFDMFFRTGSNKLVYVYRPPQIWSRPQILLDDVIGDPAAVSRGPGRFDVVVSGKDYVLNHISRNGAETRVTRISEEIKGVGQLTLIASSRNRLDLFYKSMNRRLYHAHKLGEADWVIEDVGGQMMDFPTAVRLADGSFRAYVRGLDGGLWEATRQTGNAGAWSSWAAISGPDDQDRLAGSPSAAIVNGKVQVYSRTYSGGMRKFEQAGSWMISDQPGNYASSPSASAGGVFAKSTAGSLAFSDGKQWTVIGGSLD